MLLKIFVMAGKIVFDYRCLNEYFISSPVPLQKQNRGSSSYNGRLYVVFLVY